MAPSTIASLAILFSACQPPPPAATVGTPVIVVGTPTDFGFLSVMGTRSAFSVGALAFDSKVDDVLVAGLYSRDRDTFLPLDKQTMTALPGEPTRRSVTFGPNAYCCLVNSGCLPFTDQILTVFVAVGAIPSNADGKAPRFTTPFDSKYWVLSCSQ